ncbi:ABC transporter permease [Photobacterium atrarenae]|uniref:ABC transporter permease n=1 Tax=Photobacterium atrarenae TaxID=865757 RepID=A0ABY5GKF3_9GAMM|nr:ABC transporter permease [Photobacterium atrarenae]UTV29717.1 ABC transporter permease [Photobacterium atrarenae]
MMHLSQSLRREWQVLAADGWLKALLSWVPPLLFLSVWAVFSAGIARDLPIGVVDLDQSRLSRQAVRYYDASPALAVARAFPSVEQGSAALRSGDIYALVVLAPQLEKQALLGHTPEITTFYNSQFILIAKLVKSAMMQAQGTLNAQLDTLMNLAEGNAVLSQALGKAVPIRTQITPLYNSNNHYGQFLVAGAVPAMWQILMVITTIMVLAAHDRQQSLQTWLKPAPCRRLLGKLLPYTMILWMHGLLFLVALYGVLGWPMHGSWLVLGGAQLLTVLACQGVGALLYLATLDTTRAMSLAAGFTAPAFAFVGVTFPATDMPLLAQVWRSALPVTHYLDVQLHQVNHGQHLSEATPQLLALAAFLLLLGLAVLKARKLAAGSNRQEGVA